MAKTKTASNSAATFSRSGTVITATWTKRSKAASIIGQQYDYRFSSDGQNWTAWGGWKDLNVNATSCAVDVGGGLFWVYEFKTHIKGAKKDGTEQAWSEATSTYYYASPANTPVITVTKDSSNQTSFSWAVSADDTSSNPCFRCKWRSSINGQNWTALQTVSGTSGSVTITETETYIYRNFEVYSEGWAGGSGAGAYRFIGTPPAATWAGAPSVSSDGTHYAMTYPANISAGPDMIDSITPEYYIGAPASDMSCPSGANYTAGASQAFGSSGVYHLPITTGDVIGEDECLWARINTAHDGMDSYSPAYRVLTGRLAAPTADFTLGSITAEGFSVAIDITSAGTSVPGAYVDVFLERRSTAGTLEHIGTIPNGTSSAEITSTIDLTAEEGLSIHIRNVTADGYSMTSEFCSYSTSMPSSPVLNSVTQDEKNANKVYVSWTKRWSKANGSVIAWTDDPDNWMSNDEPETYEVTETATGWYITGLDAGTTWYFRVRSVCTENDSVTQSPWSNEVPVYLSSAPRVPVLYLSEEAITEDGMVSAYWAYATTDGTAQAAADIVEMTYSGGVWTAGDYVASTESAQHIDIYAETQGWSNGDIVYLSLTTRSESGAQSDYSTPVRLVIAELPTVSITSSDFETSDTLTSYFTGDGDTTSFICAHGISSAPDVTVDGETATVTYDGNTVTFASAPDDEAEIVVTYETEDYNRMAELPFSVTVRATGESLTLAIERADDCPMTRPDGTETAGAAGETIYVKTVTPDTSDTFDISLDDLIGHLDDRASYRLIATASDAYGQTAEVSEYFIVHWDRQAWDPEAVIEADADNAVVSITPVAGGDYEDGDTCDIYRLSIDGAELIYSGAEFGTEYIDPYPAFGSESGYRIVTVTANGDYITGDGAYAMYDTTEEDDYTQLESELMVIDFGNSRIELPYNITLSNSWSKDFKRTVYLGGHTAGDHNKTVTRDLSAASVLVRGLDADGIRLMRSLAEYSGICHVRTPDGSSFAADVEVSEGMAYNSGTADYSLNIQRVDPEGYEAVTYEEWSETQ